MIPDRQHFPAFRAVLTFLATATLLAACGDGDGPSGPPPMAVTVVVAKSAPVLLNDTLPGRVVAYRNAEGRTYAHEGKLQFSEVIVDEGTDSITLRVVFPNPDKILLPGMFVRAAVAQGRMENGFLIPQKAILRAPNGDAFVWIATPENAV